MTNIIPGNPYALIENNFVKKVIYMQDATEEIKQEILSNEIYDEVINCSEYGQEIFIGQEYKDGFFRFQSPYPSWVWNKETGMWEAPIPKPTDEIYNWNETEQSWIWCDCNVNNGTAGV